MKMVVTGISKEQAREMIDRMYGSCLWAIEPGKGITAYPTDEIAVVLTSDEPAEPKENGDG